MSANLELSMVMRWRGQEIRTGLNQLQSDLRRTADTGRSTTDRLIDGTRRLEQANGSLRRQHNQTGDAGRNSLDRIRERTQDVERGTFSLGRAYDALLRRLWDLGRQRPGDQIADSLRRARQEAERSEGSFNRLRTAGRLAAGAFPGAAAAKFVLAAPLNKVWDFGTRLAAMSNTAYSDRDVAGRIAGKQELNTAIEHTVRTAGGTRDQAASTLDTLIAAGTTSVVDAITLLPGITKSATASGADPTELANIALKSMSSFNIAVKDVPKVMDMSITAGQEGGFELKDMSRWLPQQMAAASLSGMTGLDGLAKLLAANQAAIITAGSKDEAGNNMVNLLAKINSQDTAKDAKRLGIDLSGTLAAARAKGMDSLDAFLRLTDSVVGKDKRFQELRKGAANATGAEARTNLESQAQIIEGSAIGKIVQDRQALMALIALMNNRDYVKEVEGKVKLAKNTVDTNFAVVANEVGFKKEQAEQEGEMAAYKGFSAFDGPLKSVLDGLTATSREYPNLTAAMKVTTTALVVLAAAAGAASLTNALTRGGAGAAGAAGTAGILSRVTGAAGSAWRGLMTTGAFAASMPVGAFAAGAPMAAAGGVLAAGGLGYGIGTLISKAIEGTAFSDAIGRSIAVAMAAIGNKDAQAARQSELRNQPVEVTVKVSSDSAHLTAEVESQQQRQALRK